MKREEIIKSKGYNTTKIQNELFRQLNTYLEKNKKTRSQFAKELGVSKGYVSQILNGAFDFKLSKLVELSLAIGMIPEVNFTSSEEVMKQIGLKKKLEIVYSKETRIQNRQSSNKDVRPNFKKINKERREYKIAL